MKIVFLDTLALGEDMDLGLFASLGELKLYEGSSAEEAGERIADCDVVITNKVKLNEKNLSSAKNLKLICVTATGYDNIDIKYAREHGIGVCNVVGYSSASVAQVTVGMVLSLVNRENEYRMSVSSGEYSCRGVANILTPVYHEIEGMTWGIIGYGNIGKRVADVARALGCGVLVNRRHSAPGEENTDIDTLCRECDIITLHTPLNVETRGLIDSKRISMMRDGVILVNVARGAVTDEYAVAEAVKSGKIGGFACDVYSTEPFSEEHPFYSLRNESNVIMTPHMAWGAREARLRLCNEVKKNIISYFDGEIRNRVEL